MTERYENVWDALEDDPAERQNLKIRSALMMEIDRYVKGAGLTQTEAAARLGTQQSRLNDILRGRIEKCTIDRLINMLAAIGRTVDFTVTVAIDPENLPTMDAAALKRLDTMPDDEIDCSEIPDDIDWSQAKKTKA